MTDFLDRPMCGWWKTRLVRGGVWVACSIQYERTEFEPDTQNPLDRGAVMTGRLNGEIVPVASVWERRREPISESEAAFMVADSAWAKQFDPTSPSAQPRKRIDLLTAQIPDFT